MTRNFITILDVNEKVHVVNATDIIDIYDIKNMGYFTIRCADSHLIDITPETYNILIPILKPLCIPDLIKKSKMAETFPDKLPENLQDIKF